MRRQRYRKQAASRFLPQSPVNHRSREQPCLPMLDRTFPSCPSSRVEPVLLDYIIQNKLQISLRATCPIPFVADRLCRHTESAVRWESAFGRAKWYCSSLLGAVIRPTNLPKIWGYVLVCRPAELRAKSDSPSSGHSRDPAPHRNHHLVGFGTDLGADGMREEPRAGSSVCRRSGRSVGHGTAVSSFAKRAGDLSHQDCKWHIQRSIYFICLRVSIVAQNLKDQRSVVRHLYAERSQPRDSSLTFVLGKCSTRVQGDNGFKPSLFRRNRWKGCAHLEGQSRDDQVVALRSFYCLEETGIIPCIDRGTIENIVSYHGL